MKKYIVPAVALLVSGVVVSASNATEVSIRGDARARVIYKDKYDFGNSDKNGASYFDSRARFVLQAKTEGGAYAKARMRLGDTKWDGGTDAADDKNIWVDYAYIGVPMGPTLVEAGFIKSNITKFLEWDQGVARLSLDWGMGDFHVIPFYDVEREAQVSDVEIDKLNDNDWQMYGLIFKGNFSDDWKGQVNLMYSDDQRDEFSSGAYRPDMSGFIGSVFASGAVAGLGVATELGYKEANVLQSRDETNRTYDTPGQEPQDNGWGWYGKVDYAMGAFTPSLNIGFTTNGFTADNDFGWIMTGNGNNEPIAVFSQIGGGGDWLWIAPSVDYAMSEKFTLVANFVWVNVDGNDNVAIDDNRLANLMELSGSLNYKISKGADFTWKIGYLQPDFDGRLDGIGVEDDGAFGTYARLQVVF